MIKGVGCDIVDISRIARLLEKPGFAERVYTPHERERISGAGAQTAAGIWAAKEAVSKALGTGFAGLQPRDIEICRRENGGPFVQLHAGAQTALEHLGGQEICLSISHEQGQALAFAIID